MLFLTFTLFVHFIVMYISCMSIKKITSYIINKIYLFYLFWQRGKAQRWVPPLNTTMPPEFGGKWGIFSGFLSLRFPSVYSTICGIQREDKKSLPHIVWIDFFTLKWLRIMLILLFECFSQYNCDDITCCKVKKSYYLKKETSSINTYQ